MNDKPTINVGKVPVITKFIYTLGVLPTSYLMSMAFEEQLVWLCNYIGQTLIPAINNDVEAVQELQQLYVELQNYVNNYLDNINIEEDVNRKLDEMAQDGTLINLIANYVNPLISAQNTIINNFKNDVNEAINTIDNKVDIIANGSPLVATSTSEMTDTTKIYVNTTDGKWYYYNGEEWTIGGTYQSSGIADESIDILKLDSNLQANFNMLFSADEDLGTPYTHAYCKENSSTHQVQIVDNQSDIYYYYKYALTLGDILMINGLNSQNLCGIIIADSSDNVIYNSNSTGGAENWVGTSLLFKVNSNGLYAYLSQRSGSTNQYVSGHATRVRKLVSINNNLKVNNTVRLLETIEGKYVGLGSGLDTNLTYSSNANCTLYIYAMEKGKKYKISAYDWSQATGITICDNNYIKKYSSYTESSSSYRLKSYTFTAEYDGFIVITNYTGYTYSVEQVIDSINLNNKFYGYKIGCDGDSISHGVSSQNSYVTQIANANDCTLQNLSVGGATIATGTTSGGSNRHWISTSVSNLDSDCDLIMLSGGVNDYWQKVPMGEFTESYSDSVDSETFFGALETMCRNVLNKFRTQKIVFVTYHKINDIYFTYNSSTGEKHTFKEYLDAIYKVMNKYSIPVIDINSKGRLNTAIAYYKENYTVDGDGVHPNNDGYSIFYNDIIINELNNIL